MNDKALSQEPCTDTVSIRKDALKTRVGNIVAYNVEWLKKHWQMEMDIVCGVKPCDDAISRQAVLDYLKANVDDFPDYHEAIEKVLQMPSVTQKSGKWIPVSERLPEEGKDVLACFYTGEGNYKMMVSRRSDYNYWSGVGRTADMVAWMPLPKPYEPREKRCADCNHYGKLSLDCGRCDDDCSMYKPQESEDKE